MVLLICHTHQTLSYFCHCLDLGLFLFDVASDIFNGIIFVKDYNLRGSGWAVIGLIFLPMGVLYALTALFLLFDSSSCWKTLFIFILAPILAPVALPTLTVAYIAFLAYVAARQCLQPGYTPDDYNNGHSAGFLKLLRALFGASFQAVLGLSPKLETAFNVELSIGIKFCSDLPHPGERPIRRPFLTLRADCGRLR